MKQTRRKLLSSISAVALLVLSSSWSNAQLGTIRFSGAGANTTITLDGIQVVLEGSVQNGVYVDGVSPWAVAPPGGVRVLSVSITQTPESWLGGVMIDPGASSITEQGFDYRLNSDSRGPGLSYNASLAVALPVTVDHYANGSGKTIWFYRGSDVVVSGSESSGCWAYMQLTIVATAPAANAIKPTGLYVSGAGKPTYTTDDIDYNFFGASIARPLGYTEPSWNTVGNYFLARPLVHFGTTVASATYAPNLTQETYPAYQACNIGMVLLGCISDSPSRTELINRIVRDGLMIKSCVALAMNCWTSNGGFGCGGRHLHAWSDWFLGETFTIPPEVAYAAASGGMAPYYFEDAAYYEGSTEARYGDRVSTSYPTPPYFQNNNVRDGAGVREPYYVVGWSDTAQGANPFSITLAAGQTGLGSGDRIYITSGTGNGQPVVGIMAFDNTTKVAEIAGAASGVAGPITDGAGTAQTGTINSITLQAGLSPNISLSFVYFFVYIASGTGAGQIRLINSWDDITKVAGVSVNWSVTPDGTSVYQVRRSWTNHIWTTQPDNTSVYQAYNGGAYQADVTRTITGALAAVVLAGMTAEWLNDPNLARIKSWVDVENGQLGALTSGIQYPSATADPNGVWGTRNTVAGCFLDVSNWTQLWWPEASAIWPPP